VLSVASRSQTGCRDESRRCFVLLLFLEITLLLRATWLLPAFGSRFLLYYSSSIWCQVLEDWRYIAMVIDRLQLYIFFAAAPEKRSGCEELLRVDLVCVEQNLNSINQSIIHSVNPALHLPRRHCPRFSQHPHQCTTAATTAPAAASQHHHPPWVEIALLTYLGAAAPTITNSFPDSV